MSLFEYCMRVLADCAASTEVGVNALNKSENNFKMFIFMFLKHQDTKTNIITVYIFHVYFSFFVIADVFEFINSAER